MEYLHANFNLWIHSVYRCGDLTMALGMLRGGHLRTHTALFVGANTTSDHHANATPGALGKVGGQSFETAFHFF